VPREAGLLRALTATDRMSDLLPVLHHHAISAIGGQGSILFQFSRDGEALRAMSAFALENLPPDPWPLRQVPRSLFHDGRPLFVPDIQRVIRGIVQSLGSSSAVLVPIVHIDDPLGILLIGANAAPTPEQLNDAAAVGHAFAIVLERTRVAGDADLQIQLRNLLQEFGRTVSAKTLSAGLDTLCAGANRLFDADRTSVWLHDRRAREVVLSASSDVVYLAREQRIPASDALAPAAIALRRHGAEIGAGVGQTAMVTVPLKGQRRALGALIMDGLRVESGSQMDLLDRVDELGRQVSAAVENVLLLEDVLRSRRELENTFNALADLVAVADGEGRLIYANRAFLRRSRKHTHELMNRPLADAIGPAMRQLIEKWGQEFFPSAERAEKIPVPVSAEVEDPVLHGTFLVTLTPLVGEEGESTGFVLVAHDVTPHARLEAERADLRNRLAQSEKLAALGQFVAGIAHELNNPLQGVLGHLELLRATGAFPKGLRRDMQRIYREADRAAKIVRNLLVFAGSRRLVRKRTSINATLSRVLALRAPACRASNIEVVRRHEEGLPRVKGDPLLLQQALLNIVLNAEQAIGAAGGRIETHTSVQPNQDTYVLVEIRDTGPGIPPVVMPHLFEPFYTTKDVGKGTGLGLAITYGIIQEHGGQIAASNHPEGGAVFTVRLPVEPG
jgi:signal transduction histidine kinase